MTKWGSSLWATESVEHRKKSLKRVKVKTDKVMPIYADMDKILPKKLEIKDYLREE